MEEYTKHPLIKDIDSDDTIRNDINALRDAGCEISYATKLNNPYRLIKHPFNIVLKKSQLRALKKVYNRFYENFTFEELFALDSFFEKLHYLYIQSGIFDNIFIIQPTHRGQHVYFDMK